MNNLRSFLSLSGSFSRAEFLIATLFLLGVAMFFATLRGLFPDIVSEEAYRWMIYALYPAWGIALGKRSRDLGTTFTYGMIIGMIFPVLGIVFLFQAGAKCKADQAARQAAQTPPPLPPNSPVQR